MATSQADKDTASAADAAFKELYGWYHGGTFYDQILELWTNVNGHAVQSTDVKARTAHILGTLNSNPKTQKDAQAIQKYAALPQNTRLDLPLTELGGTGSPNWADPTINAVGDAASGISSVADGIAAIAGLSLDLEDPNMWISLAWLGLGLGLLAAGMVWLFKTPIENATKAIGGLAMLA